MNGRTIAVVLRYRDPERAAAWLCAALGFEVASTQEASPGVIDFIRLTYGPSTVLVCPQGESANGRADPSETQTCYLTVEDIAAHYETAKAEGALLERRLERASDGSELYVCRDPEGHVWSIGTHDFGPPRAAVPAAAAAVRPRGLGLGMLAFTAVVASALTAGAVLIVQAPTGPPRSTLVVTTTGTEAADVPLSLLAAKDREIADLRDDLASLQREHVGQAATLQQTRTELAEARRAALDKARDSELVTGSTTKSADGSAGDARLAALQAELDAQTGARLKAQADLKAADAARSEAEAARDAALADRAAAATRLATLEKAKKETADALSAARDSLAKATAEMAARDAEHRRAISEKDKRIAALEAAKTGAVASPTPPAKAKTAARPSAPPHRKAHKNQADAADESEDSLNPSVARRCGRTYYNHC